MQLLSGGVADCIKADNVTDWFQYGDIGLLLGNRIKNSLFFTKCHVLDTVETIRATVVGAGSHTAEVSGSTISYTDEILPIKNVPVLKLAKEDEQLKASELAAQIRSKLDWYLTDDNQLTNVALSFFSRNKISVICRYSALCNGNYRRGSKITRSRISLIDYCD
mgnify:CR=1 FL=1